MSMLPPNRDIFAAIREDAGDKLRRLCAGMKLDSFCDKRKSSHWLSAAMEESSTIDFLRVLVEVGVDPYLLPERRGFSPLRRAIQLGRIDYLRFLLSIGVDPNNGLSDQRVSLTAVGGGDPELQINMLRLLVEHGVDLNCRFPWFGDSDRALTVLDVAEDEEVKRFLVSMGAKTADELNGSPGGLGFGGHASA